MKSEVNVHKLEQAKRQLSFAFNSDQKVSGKQTAINPEFMALSPLGNSSECSTAFTNGKSGFKSPETNFDALMTEDRDGYGLREQN